MKTNYVNPKQQILTITLALATIISLAWVSPKGEKKTAPAVAIISNVLPVKSQTPTLFIDTPKKKRPVRIITVDASGKKTEYTSVKELPDSVKSELDGPQYFVKDFPGLPDTTALLVIQKSAEAIARKMNSPEQRAKWEKLELAMRKQGELFEKKFNSPEQRAKLERLGLKMQRQAELMERKGYTAGEQAKFRKLNREMQIHTEQMKKNLPSPELQGEMRKLNEELRERAKEMKDMMITPEIEKQLQEISSRPEAPVPPAAPAAPAPAVPEVPAVG